MFVTKKQIKLMLALLPLALVVIFPAQSVDLQKNILDQVGAGASGGGLGAPIQPQIIIATIIQAVLGIFGTVFFVLMIVSGYWFLTARGQEDKEEKALDTIRRAITGLIIVLMSYAIVTFVSLRIQRATEVDPTAATSRLLNQTTSGN